MQCSGLGMSSVVLVISEKRTLQNRTEQFRAGKERTTVKDKPGQDNAKEKGAENVQLRLKRREWLSIHLNGCLYHQDEMEYRHRHLIV